ncbi:DNL zinc finger-domain-containing protein [Dendryphion nanum]|uniref:DNL zinc finger-domain-containing protein n=1 Tax=Dendryphion nanum TaxID=256645 RepID=A0A9P9ICU4_9PLEO|nr:DNL zinc finger-domain-containing protein [Dendryphion nanum]
MRPSSSYLRCLCQFATVRATCITPPRHIPASSKRFLHTPRTSPPLRGQSILPKRWSISSQIQVRHESSASNPPQSSGASTNAPDSRLDRDQVPAYELTFTCKKCSTRSSHRVSKQGYHHGTVLITCPGCKNRHLISDHMKIFSDKSLTIEDLMREKGQLVKRGSLSAEGDVEFWDDGSSTPRSAQFVPNSTVRSDDSQEPSLTESPTSEKSDKP